MMVVVEGIPHLVMYCDEHLARKQLECVKHIKIATTCRGGTGLGYRAISDFRFNSFGRLCRKCPYNGFDSVLGWSQPAANS